MTESHPAPGPPTDLVATLDGRRLVLGPGEHLVGRAESCALRCDDLRVSRHHLTLRHSPQGWELEDAGSTGGTWRDGHRVHTLAITGPMHLHLGDPTAGVDLHLAPGDVPTPARGDDEHTGAQPNPASPAAAAAITDRSAAPRPLDRPTDTESPTAGTARPHVGGQFTGSWVSRERTTIGRSLDNDVVVDDLLVSRHHAELRRTPDGAYEIVDLGSRNGTFVDGNAVTHRTLTTGDRVAVGHSTFLFTAGMLEEYRDLGLVTFSAEGVTVPGPGGVPLVDGVSLDLGERALCAVVGPSGSGKSTLLSALAGLRPAPVGRVLYGGRDLYADYEELRNRIGYVPQEDILHRELPLRQALTYAGRLRFPADVTDDERSARVDEVLSELGLSHRAASPIDRLSGGERKRTSVALELLTKPSLLFLDEPASGLDPGLARVLMRLLRELADNGHTVVVVTHELANLALCDQVVVLAPGGVPAYVGPPEGAPARFGHDDLTDAFSDLSTQPDHDWRDPAGADAAEPELAPSPTAAGAPPQLPPPRRQQGWWSQLRTLSARYLAVLAADRRNLALLLAQAPVLGVLMLAALPAGELGLPAPPEVRLVSTAGLVLFVVLLGATWMGANNAIREIARELPVLRRERSVGLSLSAYVTSKVVVLAGLTMAQAAVLVAIATARQRGPDSAVVLGWPTGELMVVVALAGVASMAVALLVSALAGSPERATSVLPMLLILQLVLSAGAVLPEIADRPVLREMSYLSSAQWGVSAAASTADLNELALFDERLRDLRTVDAANPVPAVEALSGEAAPEGRWAHTPSAWLTAVGALLALTVASVLATILALRRFDPGR